MSTLFTPDLSNSLNTFPYFHLDPKLGYKHNEVSKSGRKQKGDN